MSPRPIGIENDTRHTKETPTTEEIPLALIGIENDTHPQEERTHLNMGIENNTQHRREGTPAPQ